MKIFVCVVEFGEKLGFQGVDLQDLSFRFGVVALQMGEQCKSRMSVGLQFRFQLQFVEGGFGQ